MQSVNNLTVLHTNPTWLQQTQTWMYSQISELQKLGVNAHIVCNSTENLEQFSLANIHSLAEESLAKKILIKGMRRLGIQNCFSYIGEIGRKTNASVLHSHFGDIGWANLDVARSLNIKHAVTFYGYDVNYLPKIPIWKERYVRLFNEADLFFCEGSHMANCLIKLGCPQHKIKVQHLGVDVNRFDFKPRQWKKDTPLKVLIAASFREKKGIPYAITALGLILKNTPLELTIIGDAGEDKAGQLEKAAILSIIENNGLKPFTRLLGYQPHSIMLQEAYENHIFLHPSVTASNGDTEGGAPVSIIEMLATGMLVVSTMHCDIPEVMGSELHHLLAPERNITELVKIMQILIANPNSWGSIAHKGRNHVVLEYNLSIQAKRQQEHYSKLIRSESMVL